MITNPFAAAISTLVDRIAALTEKASYETARERQALLDEAEALRVGWRVLEAAGEFLSIQGDSPRAVIDRIGANNKLLDALLATLPDKPKKEK